MKINILKLGFCLKFISRDELIGWSDSNLIDDNNFNFFLELSSISSKDKNDSIIHIIEKHFKNYAIEDFETIHSIILSFIIIDDNNWVSIQKKLIHYFDLIQENLTDRDFGFRSALKDDLQLRKEGFPGCLKIPRDLKLYFNSFKIRAYEESFLLVILENYDLIPYLRRRN